MNEEQKKEIIASDTAHRIKDCLDRNHMITLLCLYVQMSVSNNTYISPVSKHCYL